MALYAAPNWAQLEANVTQTYNEAGYPDGYQQDDPIGSTMIDLGDWVYQQPNSKTWYNRFLPPASLMGKLADYHYLPEARRAVFEVIKQSLGFMLQESRTRMDRLDDLRSERQRATPDRHRRLDFLITESARGQLPARIITLAQHWSQPQMMLPMYSQRPQPSAAAAAETPRPRRFAPRAEMAAAFIATQPPSDFASGGGIGGGGGGGRAEDVIEIPDDVSEEVYNFYIGGKLPLSDTAKMWVERLAEDEWHEGNLPLWAKGYWSPPEGWEAYEEDLSDLDTTESPGQKRSRVESPPRAVGTFLGQRRQAHGTESDSDSGRSIEVEEIAVDLDNVQQTDPAQVDAIVDAAEDGDATALARLQQFLDDD